MRIKAVDHHSSLRINAPNQKRAPQGTQTKATNFLRLIAFGLDNTYNYFSIFASVSSRIACRNVVRYSEKLTRSSA